MVDGCWELLGSTVGLSKKMQDASLPFITCSQNGMSLADMWIVSPDNKVRRFWWEKGFPMAQKHGWHTVGWCKMSVRIVTKYESWQASFGTCSSAIRPLGSRESRNSLVCSLHRRDFWGFHWLHGCHRDNRGLFHLWWELDKLCWWSALLWWSLWLWDSSAELWVAQVTKWKTAIQEDWYD